MAEDNNNSTKKCLFTLKLPFTEVAIPVSQKMAILIIIILVLLASAVTACLSPVGRTHISKLLHSSNVSTGLRVAVFYPDPERASGSGGAPYQDGKVQRDAFKRAWFDFKNKYSRIELKEPSFNEYYFSPQSTDLDKRPLNERLIGQMKKLYYDEEEPCRIFLMTMSSAVEAVKPDFIKWRKTCKKKKYLPILIATVASAPGLADSSNGIYRLYIRSTEESARLAEYLAWAHDVQMCGVFYITKTQGADDEAYGKGGKEIFAKRWRGLRHENPYFYDVTRDTKNVKKQVKRFMEEVLKENNAKGSAKPGVFIVGYGQMFTSVVDELILQNFPGPIACVSTLTVPSWQPEIENADQRIFTVLPICTDSHDALPPIEHDVIYLIAKETFFKTLACAVDSDSTEDFAVLWTQKSHESEKFHAEYLVNGDAIIQLEVIGSDVWRKTK